MKVPRSARQIHSAKRSSELRDLLQSLFVGEMLLPSRCLWLVSPWISDIPVLNNESHSFAQLAPEWPRGQVLLSRVIARMLDAGTTVHVATRENERNRSFLTALNLLARDPHLQVHMSDELHEKGLLGDEYYLSGSMNFTITGIQISEEVVHLITDPADVARNRVSLTQRWGGEWK